MAYSFGPRPTGVQPRTAPDRRSGPAAPSGRSRGPIRRILAPGAPGIDVSPPALVSPTTPLLAANRHILGTGTPKPVGLLPRAPIAWGAYRGPYEGSRVQEERYAPDPRQLQPWRRAHSSCSEHFPTSLRAPIGAAFWLRFHPYLIRGSAGYFSSPTGFRSLR